MNKLLLIIPFLFSCAHQTNTQEKIISRDDVKAAVQSSTADFRACYEKASQDTPNIAEGKVVLAWEVHELGIVHFARVDAEKSSLRHNQLEDCMLNVLQKIKMPAPPAESVAEVAGYPFIFTKTK